MINNERESGLLMMQTMRPLRRKVLRQMQNVWSNERGSSVSNQMLIIKKGLLILKIILATFPSAFASFSKWRNQCLSREDWKRLMQHKRLVYVNKSMVHLYEVNLFCLKPFAPFFCMYTFFISFFFIWQFVGTMNSTYVSMYDTLDKATLRGTNSNLLWKIRGGMRSSKSRQRLLKYLEWRSLSR